jgi:hypothetical protein
MAPKIIRGRRAILKKDGAADVSVSLLEQENGTLEVIIDGRSGTTWPVYTPQQLMTGNTPPRTLEGVGNRCCQSIRDMR